MQTQERAKIKAKLGHFSENEFDDFALHIFRYQAQYNLLYRRFLDLLRVNPLTIKDLAHIPCLPISFFKTHEVKTGAWSAQQVFESSGTTGQTTSRHLVHDPVVYLDNTLRGFAPFFGDPADWLIVALLPSYLERSGSSLIAMFDFFIQKSKYPESGFFLHDLARLRAVLDARPKGVPTLLLGVTYALLDFADQYPGSLEGVTIMETGGMKGRRREMTRSEVHAILKTAFGVQVIDSEYGMTELYSQAYLAGSDFFRPAPTLRAFTTEINDPLTPTALDRTGVLNLVDLANFDTCSFIASADLGRVKADHSFEVLGRLDAAELRGCNLMVE
jgi:hypothetical protein